MSGNPCDNFPLLSRLGCKGEELLEGRRACQGEGPVLCGERGSNFLGWGASQPLVVPQPLQRCPGSPDGGSPAQEPRWLTFLSWKIFISFSHRGPWSVLLFRCLDSTPGQGLLLPGKRWPKMKRMTDKGKYPPFPTCRFLIA